MDIQSQIKALRELATIPNVVGGTIQKMHCSDAADTMQLMLAVCDASRQACECVTHDSVQRCLDIVRMRLTDLNEVRPR